MDGSAFRAINCNIEATNSEFTNATADVVLLAGGKYSFTHCTIANYMTLKKRNSPSDGKEDNSYTLSLLTDYNSVSYNMEQAYFDNCIIDGNHSAGKNLESGELRIKLGTILQSNNQNYQFNHCVIKLQEMKDDKFKDIIFVTEKDENKMEYRMTGGDKNKYMYDFRPDKETTPGVGKADLFVTQKYPIDRYGVNRLTNDGPDIGAYEYVPKEEDK